MKDTRVVDRHEQEEEEEEEPPVLGDEDEVPLIETRGDNQRDEQADETSLMDEMVVVAARAKAEKRRESERTRTRTGFGDGLKKGFFNRPARTAGKKKAAVLEPADGRSLREERLRIVEPTAAEAEAGDAVKASAFVFPEVQEAMKGAQQLDPKEWMNAQFFDKLVRNPRLAQALRNPAFTQAIADMQVDPRAAMLKYQKDAAVAAMLRDFMEFLGAHFEEMGKQSTDQQQQQPEQPATPSVPAIVDLDAARREALAAMPRSAEEEAQMQRILANPELQRALADGKLMQRLREAQETPGGLRALMADARMGPQLRLLLDNGLVTFGS